MVWEIRVTGADTNGGAFKTGATGSDFSQQDAAQYSVTDGVTAGSTTITSATAAFGTDVVGNVMYVQGGTGSVTAGWYEITVRNSATSVTVDRSTGLTAGTGVTLKIGGALLSPGQASALGIDGNKYYIKAGTYTITSATPSIAGGCFKPIIGSNGQFLHVEGYQTTRGDRGTAPVLILNTGVTSATIVDLSAAGTYARLINLEADGHNETGSRGFNTGAVFGLVERCLARNCKNNGFAVGATNPMVLLFCRATACSALVAFTAGTVGTITYVGCEADANTAGGFGGNGFACVRCLAYNNTGASSDGFYSAIRASFFNCSAYGNGRSGFRSGTGAVLPWVNCVAEANGGYGFDSDGAAGFNPVLINCAAYNNTSGAYSTTTYPSNLIVGFLTLTGSPFTNAAAANFALNNTSGAGASLRAASYPAGFLDGLTTGSLDIGAAQHADPTSIQYRPSLSGNV